MPRIDAHLSAPPGVERVCDGCASAFTRHAPMNLVTYNDGTPAGIFCEDCVAEWQRTNVQPEPEKEAGDE